MLEHRHPRFHNVSDDGTRGDAVKACDISESITNHDGTRTDAVKPCDISELIKNDDEKG